MTLQPPRIAPVAFFVVFYHSRLREDQTLTLFRLGLVAGFIVGVIMPLEFGMPAVGAETIFVIGIPLAAWGCWYDWRVRRCINHLPARREQTTRRE
jgi:hypothetical protein